MRVEKFINLFGEEETVYVYEAGKPHGYASTPGRGPAGQTCRTCEHRVKLSAGNKTFYKCGKNRHNWGSSIASDIVLKTPACNLWEATLSKTPLRR